MKQAKRILSLLLAVMMSVSLLAVSASAATTTSEREMKAQVLFALGLFKGYDNTGKNFGLSDGATREQALLFLIRMLGEEKAAEAWSGAQPYSDVPSSNYYHRYIGYAKAKGYTNGIGNNKFGIARSANMTQMAAFALRGLGYSEAAGDFTYPNSVPFAVSLGILDSSVIPATFTRGDAVDVLDGAVAANVKNQNYTLLEKLVSSGAVTQAQIEKAAAIANGTTADIAAGTYTLKCMGNSLRVTSDKLELRNSSPAQTFTITNRDGYSYIQTADGYYVGVTSLKNGTQLVLGTTPYSWLIQKQSGSNYTIRPAEKPTMVVNACEEKSTNGTKMIIWTHSGAPKNTLITFTAASKNIAVTGVKLDQTTANVAVGKKIQLTGDISPANATNQDVTWSSSSSSIAKVDSNGVVTGVKAGTATITAKTVDGSKTASCKVTVTAATTYTDKTVYLYNSTNQAATDIRISSTQNDDWGKNLTSGAVQPNANVGIIVPVSSSDYTYDIAIVYADGSTATFTAYNFKSFSSGGSLYAYIDKGTPMLSTTKPGAAKVPVTGIKLDQTSASMVVGKTLQLTGTISPANATNQNVTWSSSASSVATVDSSGMVTAVKVGTAVMVATTVDGGRTATCTVTVTGDTIAASKTLRNRYNAAVTRFNATQEQLVSAGLYIDPLKTNWDSAATQLNTELSFIISGSGVYTESQISTANAILNEVDTMLTEMDALIKEAKAAASKPVDAKKTITIINNTGETFSLIQMAPDTATYYDHPVSNSNLKQGESAATTIDFTGVSLVWDMQILYPNKASITFTGIDFTNCPAAGTITLNSDGTAQLSW